MSPSRWRPWSAPAWVESPRGRTVRGHDPTGSDRLLIRPAAMVARPVPAARGHFARKARPETAGYEWATRAASASLPRAGGTGATSISSSERPVTIRATLPAGTNPVRSPSGHRRGASQSFPPSFHSAVHPIVCRMRLDHPDDHPDDPSGSVGSRLDRQGIQREQARSVWNRPSRRRASVS